MARNHLTLNNPQKALELASEALKQDPDAPGAFAAFLQWQLAGYYVVFKIFLQLNEEQQGEIWLKWLYWPE